MSKSAIDEKPTEIEDVQAGILNESKETEQQAEILVPKKSDTLEIFKMVFEAAQRPDNETKKLQKCMAWILTISLCIQVVWALVMIPIFVLNKENMPTSMITFASLLVTAILGEVVAMAFVVVRFAFRTPLDTMIDLLKDIVNKK